VNVLTVVGWVVVGPLAAALVTFVAGRLLGARRGWLALATSGVIGFTGGVVTAGALTGWEWSTLDMVLLTLLFGTLFTMAVALGLDLFAPIGTLHRGAAAGLVAVSNPMSGMRRKVLPFRRYREVVAIARRNGVGSRGISAESLPVGVRHTLEEAGGIFVKLGQVASTRSDVLPRIWCDELARLRSAAAPVPEAEMRPHIAALLGADPAERFATFDWTPLASASISQVYRATLLDGTPVIVKVQRPGLDDALELDSAAIMQIARLIERRTPIGLSVRPADLAKEFLDSVLEELDFGIEAANAGELGAGLAAVVGVRIPQVYPELSGPRILTEELVVASSVGELAVDDDIDRVALADRLISLFLHQIFTVGVFHADPHPGNILVERDGTIVLIDLGAVGRLGPSHRDAVLDMMAAASSGDASGLRQALERITLFDRRIDLRLLDVAIHAFFGRHLRAGGSISAAAFEDIAVLIGQFGIRLPRWFGTLSRTLVTLEGTIKGLDPDFSLVDAAKRYAATLVQSMVGDDPQQIVQRELIAEMPRLRRLPERIDDLLAQAVSGRLTAQMSLFADERDERLVSRLADRLTLAVIAAATMIGSIMLMGVDVGPTFGDGDGRGVALNEVLGYFGLAMGVVLAFRLVAGVVRDGET
jgi:ubiquinone biosynthesis protein